MKKITFSDIQENEEIRTYIRQAGLSLEALGFTEHGPAHVSKVADTAGYILETIGSPERERELVMIAGFMHDIGNMVNRDDHSKTGAVLVFQILNRLGMDPSETAKIVTAVGNHDEGTGQPVDDMSAAMILADKADVRRTRVTKTDPSLFDIHDRVNFSVEKSYLVINEEKTAITLNLQLDTHYCSVMEYFEIFMNRMILCRKAACQLKLEFRLVINGARLL